MSTENSSLEPMEGKAKRERMASRVRRYGFIMCMGLAGYCGRLPIMA
jgi:hypothetical protein